MMFSSKNIKILSTGSYVPSRIVPNKELESSVKTSSEWIFENLGILERRISEPTEYTSDLAYKAGLNAIANAGIDKNEINLIIVATATPDRRAPSTACLVQEKMEITNHCSAFDISAVCSGFLYAMTVGSQFIETGMYKKVLVIGADTFSKITDWNRRDCVFFGDGAGAVVLSLADPHENSLFSSMLYADGTGKNNFTLYPGDPYFSMIGKAVYETGTKVIPEAIHTILSRNNLKINDISWVVPHQPSIRILKKSAENLALPFDQFLTNMDRYANTSGATIPLVLDEANRAGKFKKNDLLAFAAVGSGWTWGASLYQWI